jgi:hypothetical protein
LINELSYRIIQFWSTLNQMIHLGTAVTTLNSVNAVQTTIALAQRQVQRDQSQVQRDGERLRESQSQLERNQRQLSAAEQQGRSVGAQRTTGGESVGSLIDTFA